MINCLIGTLMYLSFINGAWCLESSMVIATNRPTMVNLSCYSCSSLEDPYCLNVTNATQDYLSKECRSKEKMCSVTRIEYENSDHTGTVFWALERKCSSSCIQGCIILGERTRLHYCSSCCSDDLCNTNSMSIDLKMNNLLIVTAIMVHAIFELSLNLFKSLA
ncbi:uncharacterized protein LOC107361841 [Tetranychus urticae]|uniref:Protein quiver n=1 Tax=Tetranychus urticae TaxID=32264 RepID=T1K870_TETUR|nr:uncharacterized protein LOC107361841 [Tetranychus urticae]